MQAVRERKSILHRLMHQFRIWKAVAFVTNKEWAAYRTHSLVSVFVGPVYFVVQYFIWTSVYQGKGAINGMELSQMLTYFGANALIGYLTMDFADWNLQMLVRTGKFITFAMRPLHHRFFAFSQKCGHRVLGFCLEFVPCYILFVLLFDVDMMPKQIGWTVLSVALAFMMNFYINYTIGLTAFWLTQSSGIRQVFNVLTSIFSGAVIPLVFFPNWLQYASFFLPFQYISYVPAMVFTGRYELAGIVMSIPQIVLLQALGVLVMYCICEIFYRCSIKRFTGVGA